jgi:hypothetical protein
MFANPFLRFPVLLRFSTLTLVLGWLTLAICPGFAWTSELPAAEQKKIEALILGVERMTDAVFIRNGKNYNAPAAADFLRRKWEFHRSEICSAGDFIEKVASFSSTTGKPYSIRWRNGQERLSAEFFRAQLSLLERRSVKQSS